MSVDNNSDNEEFGEIVSRRGFILAGLATAGLASMGGVESVLSAVPGSVIGKSSLLGFKGVPISEADKVIVPEGYTAKVLISWGDPISDGPEFKQDASNTSADQAVQWGMHNDGLVYFPFKKSSKRGLIAENNEYVDDELLFPDGSENWDAEKTAKSQNAHGVSIIEVRKRKVKKKKGSKGRRRREWQVVRPSKYARRITAQTRIALSGPAAGDPRLKTSYDPNGTWVRGTLNNCAMGYTPWGTYLTCEENFNGYFVKDAERTDLEKRYGIQKGGFGYHWHKTDKRFDLTVEPNEVNKFGWVVEIDPFKPDSTPIKRTFLGRMKHECAKVQEAKDGRIVVYTGDDQGFEYIYRFVSKHKWKKAIKKGKSPLDEGTLYVAKFHDTGKGEWIPLTPQNPALTGWSIQDILINTRGAADEVKATKMDRPEWIDTFPKELSVVATLTNNSGRGVGDWPGKDAANPRDRNVYGGVIKWSHKKDWTENEFTWEHFALAGNPDEPSHGSTIKGDKYGSPDGIYVAPSGRLWIQTDVSRSNINPEDRSGRYEGFGNNAMLAVDPDTRETRRFLVGPNVCEVTGVFCTPDEKTMFVGIQHPGESAKGRNDPKNPKRWSSWPDGDKGGRPRSSLLVITKDDGGKIGS